jgi:predicted RNA methylase
MNCGWHCGAPSAEAIVSRTEERWRARETADLTQQRSALRLLIQRLVLALTRPGDLVVDPYVGVGSTAGAAVLNKRRAAGAEIVPEYINIARDRVESALMGKLAIRPMGRPVHKPDIRTSVARRPPELDHQPLFDG